MKRNVYRVIFVMMLGVMFQANPAGAVTNCLKHNLLSLSPTRGQNCQTLATDKSLKFKSPQDVELLNVKINGFKCLKARVGQTICYRP